jgi:hypothetical protein
MTSWLPPHHDPRRLRKPAGLLAGEHANGKFVSGSTYALFVLNCCTTAAAGDGAARRSTIYWVVSTWNPYEVVVMRTTLQSELR